jgi:SAM-dependent methyltransferase
VVAPATDRIVDMTDDALQGHLTDNLQSWDERAPAHFASPDYAVQKFIDQPDFLSGVVTFDLPRLGDVSGLRAVHLQCHIGTDTESLARLGASMTGLDFSPAAIEQARLLARSIGSSTDYVVSDVYDAVSALGGQKFDLVFTGIGALCWLPDIDRWANVVGQLLAPGGRLFIREGHPMLWSIDEERQEGLVVDFPYFQTVNPVTYSGGGTYVQTQTEFARTTSHTWNHGFGEIVSALLAQGLVIDSLVEHDSVPWEALPGKMVKDDLGEWRLFERRERLAMSYTLTAHLPVV